jgi:xanthine dehydrogenase YagT iron-sulfur-binding subunit
MAVNRRGFLGVTAATAASSLVSRAGTAQAPSPPLPPPGDRVALSLAINGQTHRVSIDPRVTLLDLVRDHIGLTGSKKGCDHGQCGACTVLVGKQRVLSCLTLAATVREEVTTIEGLSPPEAELHPMQQAFIEHDAFQCGYCTPGQILSAIACVHEKHASNDDQIREYMSGNICRCAAYPNIVAAIRQAKSRMEQA